MNLASRHATNNSGNTHSMPPPSIAGGTTNQLQGSQHHMNRGNNAYPNIFNSGLSVPRQISVPARGAVDNSQVTIRLDFVGTIGQGTFGQIERATLTVGEPVRDAEARRLNVAVKRVLQDPRYKNRELSIMQRLNNHPNVVKFYYYYYSTSSNARSNRSGSNRTGSSNPGVDVFLHLVLECFPESLCELIYRYSQRNLRIPVHAVKVFTFQMLKALAYLHENQICHRDIKSSNLLVNESTLVLKVCDLGSAKEMIPGGVNVSYISSRYYRAPELLFGAQMYSCLIDIWSVGCVVAEMLRQNCLFTGNNSLDQLVKVIRVLGTPSQQDIVSMNPVYRTYNFPDVPSCPVRLFFPQHTPTELLALMSLMLVYNPSHRIEAAAALEHPCFDDLRRLGPNGLLLDQVPMPPHLFEPNPPISTFTDEVGGEVGKNNKVTPTPAGGGTLVNDEAGRRRSHHSKQHQLFQHHQQQQAMPLAQQNHSGAPGGDGTNSVDCQRKGRGQPYLKQSPPGQPTNCSHLGAQATLGPKPTPSSRKLTSNNATKPTTTTTTSSSTAAIVAAGKNGVSASSSSSSPACQQTGKRSSELVDGSTTCEAGQNNNGSRDIPTASGRHHDGADSGATGGDSRTSAKQSLSEATAAVT